MLNRVERQFLKNSIRRRNVVALTGTGIAALVLLVVGFAVYFQRLNQENERISQFNNAEFLRTTGESILEAHPDSAGQLFSRSYQDYRGCNDEGLPALVGIWQTMEAFPSSFIHLKADAPIACLDTCMGEDKVLVGTFDGSARMFDLGSDSTLLFWRPSTSKVEQIFRIRRTLIIVTVDNDAVLKAWRMDTTGTKWHVDSVFGLQDILYATQRGDGCLAVANLDGEAQLLDPRQNFKAISSPYQAGWVRTMAFVPNSNLLLTIADDKGMKMFDTDVGEEVETAFPETPGKVYSLDFGYTPYFFRYGMYATTKAINWIDTDNNTITPLCNNNFLSFCSKFNPANMHAFTSDEERRVMVERDMLYCDEIKWFKGHNRPVSDMLLNPSFDRLLTSSNDSTLRTWPLHSPLHAIHEFEEQDILSASISADGHVFSLVSETGKVSVRDVWSGRELLRKEREASQDSTPAKEVVLKRGFYKGKVLRREGPQLVVADPQSKARLAEIQGHSDSILHIFQTAEGGYLWTFDDKMNFVLWRTEHLTKVLSFSLVKGIGHVEPILSVSFSADGKTCLLVLKTRDAHILNFGAALRVWELREKHRSGSLNDEEEIEWLARCNACAAAIRLHQKLGKQASLGESAAFALGHCYWEKGNWEAAQRMFALVSQTQLISLYASNH